MAAAWWRLMPIDWVSHDVAGHWKRPCFRKRKPPQPRKCHRWEGRVVIVLLSPYALRGTPRLSGRPHCYETLVSSRGSEKAGAKIAALTESSSLSSQTIGKSKEKLRKRTCPSPLVGKESACIRHMHFWPSKSLIPFRGVCL